MPPPTPRTTRDLLTGLLATLRADALSLTFGVFEQAAVDLAKRDGQRLLARARLDQRADVLQQALAELGVVVVDLAGALGGIDRQRVLGADLLEQVIDRRVGDAF